MEERKGAQVMLAALTVMLCLSIGASGVFRLREANVRREMAMQQQREMADVIAAMADIEVNLSKLLIASGARQSVSLLGETALLAQHVESGLSRMAVSEQTAREMAAGGVFTTDADACIAVTGIAGPDGGTEEKPGGLVYIACYMKDKVKVEEYHFRGNREKVREQTVIQALDLLRRSIIKNYKKD